MSCNRPNIYGSFNPFGVPQVGESSTGYGGGYVCTGCVGNTYPAYAMGYGTDWGSTIPDIAATSYSPQTQVALGTYYWDQIKNEERQMEIEKTKTKNVPVIVVAIILGLLGLFVALFWSTLS